MVSPLTSCAMNSAANIALRVAYIFIFSKTPPAPHILKTR